MSNVKRKRRRKPKKKGFDVKKNVNIAVKTGKVYIGSGVILRKLRFESLKFIIVSVNCPAEILADIRHALRVAGSDTRIYTYKLSSWDLGEACGKPFMVSALGIEDPGDSDILKLLEKMPSQDSPGADVPGVAA